MMFSQVVVLLFLCCIYVNCVSAENPEINELERKINLTKAGIEEVQQANTNLERQISDLELDFKKNVTELQAQYTNVSEEILKEKAKTKELYITLTLIREKKSLLETEINKLQHWIKKRKLGVMFINQDLEVYHGRINNGSAEKCSKFQELLLLLSKRAPTDDDDQDMILMLQNELNQARTKLSYVSSVKKELQMKLENLIPYYKLKISDLLELLERSMGDEKDAKETVKKFVTELTQLDHQVLDLEVEKNSLIKEQVKIEHDLIDLRGALSKITQEIDCFKKLELSVLNTTQPSVV